MNLLELVALGLMGFEIGEAFKRHDGSVFILLFCTVVFSVIRIRRLLAEPRE